MKGRKRHDIAYKCAWVLVRPYLIRKFNYEFDDIDTGYSPYIVVSNHVTNWDPLLIGMSFKKSMYYVATDHVFRMGFKSKLLKFFFSPIPRVKSINETNTVINVFRRLKEGSNVCIFVEGNTSFDGETGEMLRSIGKLVKKSGAALVSYRFLGSYFSFPRWARFSRKGKMSGRLVDIYSPEKLAAMSEEEINEIIVRDIYVNAYDNQKKNPVAYLGKNKAEYLETLLYCCPACGQFTAITSNGDEVSCPCGFRVQYNDFGYFEYPPGYLKEKPNAGDKPPFTTVLEWSKWQKKEIVLLAEKIKTLSESTPVFSDNSQVLYLIIRASHNTFVAEGKLCFYCNRLAIIPEEGEPVQFMFTDIVDMAILTMMTIIFSTRENKVYEIHSPYPRNAVKYMELFKAVKQGQKKDLPPSGDDDR